MKRTLSLVAIATAASVAGPLKVGADALLGLNLPVIGSDMEDIDSKLGFGVAVGPTFGYAVTDKFSVGAGVSFQYNTFGWESSSSSFDMSVNTSLMTLGFQVAPSIQVTEQLSLKAGYEWSMPLAGKATFESDIDMFDGEETDLVWAPSKREDLGEDEGAVMSTHALVVGGAFKVAPNLAVTAQGKFALTGLFADYEDGDLKGAASADENMTIHQVAVGVSYDLGL